MDRVRARRRLAASPLAPVAALVPRVKLVGSHEAKVTSAAIRWLVTSREHTNLTYDLTSLNREHLAWFVANVTSTPVGQVRGFLDEIENDDALRQHVRARTQASSRRGIADPTARYARRIGWYAIIRAAKPDHVVETGTDKGLGSCVIAAALLRNGKGHLTTIDINPEAGYLISQPYSAVIDRRVGDSLETLRALTVPVDVFLHDSDHSVEYEGAELAAVTPHLSDAALVMSDNSHVSTQLAQWAESRDWNYLFFDERPADHWYPGDGLGVALRHQSR